MSPADLQARVVDRLIDVKLADEKAAAAGFQQDPVIAQRLHMGEATMVADAFLEKQARARINDDVLKAKYDELVKQVKPPEEVHARHILVKSEAEARRLSPAVSVTAYTPKRSSVRAKRNGDAD